MYMKCIKNVKTAKVIMIGEHSRTGHFHYHGVFCGIPNDVVDKLGRSLRHNLGRTEIKMITFTESYQNYMLKAYRNDPDYPETWVSKKHIFINV